MQDKIKILNPGRTMNIFADGHLTQIQHKGHKVDVVDHFDKGRNPVAYHFVTKIGPDESISFDES